MNKIGLSSRYFEQFTVLKRIVNAANLFRTGESQRNAYMQWGYKCDINPISASALIISNIKKFFAENLYTSDEKKLFVENIIPEIENFGTYYLDNLKRRFDLLESKISDPANQEERLYSAELKKAHYALIKVKELLQAQIINLYTEVNAEQQPLKEVEPDRGSNSIKPFPVQKKEIAYTKSEIKYPLQINIKEKKNITEIYKSLAADKTKTYFDKVLEKSTGLDLISDVRWAFTNDKMSKPSDDEIKKFIQEKKRQIIDITERLTDKENIIFIDKIKKDLDKDYRGFRYYYLEDVLSKYELIITEFPIYKEKEKFELTQEEAQHFEKKHSLYPYFQQTLKELRSFINKLDKNNIEQPLKATESDRDTNNQKKKKSRKEGVVTFTYTGDESNIIKLSTKMNNDGWIEERKKKKETDHTDMIKILNNKEPAQKIIWLKGKGELRCFIQKLSERLDHNFGQWEAADRSFTLKKYKDYSILKLKTSTVSATPQNEQAIDELIKIL